MAETQKKPGSNVIGVLKKRYKCRYFRILVIGRANAGKTTILEKVCGVERGTKPIIYDEDGSKLKDAIAAHLTPTMERGIHNIEHQITYPGSNFIFHDSEGFEAGDNKELHAVWSFIEKKSGATKVEDQLHAIWYCIPMEGSRPILSSELEFFDKGTGKVPLVIAFTKFDAQIIQEYVKLDDMENEGDKWDQARQNADSTLQRVYLYKVLHTKFPPKAYVQLEDMDQSETDCHELTEKTAGTIDDSSLYGLFVTTQMNHLNLCVKYALQ